MNKEDILELEIITDVMITGMGLSPVRMKELIDKLIIIDWIGEGYYSNSVEYATRIYGDGMKFEHDFFEIDGKHSVTSGEIDDSLDEFDSNFEFFQFWSQLKGLDGVETELLEYEWDEASEYEDEIAALPKIQEAVSKLIKDIKAQVEAQFTSIEVNSEQVDLAIKLMIDNGIKIKE